ncbi:MAG: ATPase, T2SS/T4P/T4SS family [Candidatus Eisenbacteria bacterium]
MHPSIQGKRPTVTAILGGAGVVTEEQVQAGLTRQRETGRRIGECLVELGFVSEEDIAWALARQLGLSFVDVRGETLDGGLVKSFPEPLLRRLQFVPIVQSEDRLVVAAADPTDTDAMHEIEAHTGMRVDYVSATATAIEHAIDEVLGTRFVRRSRPASADPGRHDVVWERSGETFLQFHVTLALRAGATEIHFVQAGESLNVFHRIGRQIYPAHQESGDVADLLEARLESMGMLPNRDPENHQSCSGVIAVEGRDRPMLVSRLVSRDRVSITIRLLRDPEDSPRLEHLGLEPLDLARLRGLATEPSGLVLVCGQVGSGCTTTLAALLAELPTEDRRWLIFARDQRRWPTVPGLVDILTGPGARRWRRVTDAHGADGLVLDGGLEGRRAGAVLDGTSHGRWMLASTDWEDSFSLVEWLARHPIGHVSLARRLRAVIQQRLVAAPPLPGAPGVRRAVFEVLFITDTLRTAILQGASARQMSVLARGDGFRSMSERIRAGVASGLLDATDAARVLG